MTSSGNASAQSSHVAAATDGQAGHGTLRILIMSSEFPPFRGGIATYSLELAKAAAAEGLSVTVLAPDYFTDNTTADAAYPFKVIRYRAGAASLKSLPARIAAARKVLRARSFDIVHAADWPFYIPARLLAPRGARVLLTLHGTEIAFMASPRRSFALRLLRFWQSGWAEWIANSRFTMDAALRTLPIARRDARAVTLGVSDEWLKDQVERDAARQALGVAQDQLIILSLGRVVVRKGHGVLADALALLPPGLAARVSWWIVGPMLDTAHCDSIRQKVAQSCIHTELFDNLPLAAVKQRVAASDLHCLPGFMEADGKVEGFGLAFLEVGAYGVPSIATRSGGVPEAIDDGITGILVPERDATALATAIQELLEDDDRRAVMAAAARQRAERSSWHAAMRLTYLETETTPETR